MACVYQLALLWASPFPSLVSHSRHSLLTFLASSFTPLLHAQSITPHNSRPLRHSLSMSTQPSKPAAFMTAERQLEMAIHRVDPERRLRHNDPNEEVADALRGLLTRLRENLGSSNALQTIPSAASWHELLEWTAALIDQLNKRPESPDVHGILNLIKYIARLVSENSALVPEQEFGN